MVIRKLGVSEGIVVHSGWLFARLSVGRSGEKRDSAHPRSSSALAMTTDAWHMDHASKESRRAADRAVMDTLATVDPQILACRVSSRAAPGSGPGQTKSGVARGSKSTLSDFSSANRQKGEST